MVTKYKFLNLDCPVCADKIREKILKMNQINDVKIDFLNKILIIDTDEVIDEKLFLKIKYCVEKEEPDAKILSFDEKENLNKTQVKDILNKDIFEIILASILIILSVLIKDNIFFLSFIFSVVAAFVCGREIFLKGLKSIFKLKFDEKALLTLAVFAAFFLGEIIEAVLVILLFRIGEFLENRAVQNSQNSIKEFSKIIPDQVNLLVNGKEKKVDAEKIGPGDIFLVSPFERIPCDGVVLDGVSEIDQSAITGESLPITVEPRSNVLAGCINTYGTLTMKATHAVKESAVSRILNLIENAVGNKSNSENIITKFAKIYTPLVLILAILIALIPPILNLGDFYIWLKRALVLLVASCPCAIVISVPLAFCTGIGLASKFGVLFKGGKFLELLSKVDLIAFDKTATLTKGELSIDNIYSFNDFNKKEVLKIAASLERHSSHPIAKAIIKSYSKDSFLEVKNLTEIPGLGIKGEIDNKEVLCGKRELFLKSDINLAGCPNMFVYLSIEKKILGGISLKDNIRDDAKSTISELKKLGVKNLAILSGDDKLATEKIAKKCGIDNFYYKLMPEDKLKIFNNLKKNSKVSAFVGDGINDAPTLVSSDCGIAMGFGTSVAVESGDVILTGDNINVLSKAIILSRKVISMIKFNITLSLIIKFFVLVLACFGLAPMWLAVLADTGLTLIAILNSSLFIKLRK